MLKAIKQKGHARFCNTEWELMESQDGKLHLRDVLEGGDMWVWDNPRLPLIVSMQNNPVEIDWEVTSR